MLKYIYITYMINCLSEHSTTLTSKINLKYLEKIDNLFQVINM